MRGWLYFTVFLACMVFPAKGQEQVIDRMVARVDDDVILQSDVQELSRYQTLVDGKAESDTKILDRLIDQWIVRHEADIAQFPHPPDQEITNGVDRLKKGFASHEEYEAQRKRAGLSEAEVQLA